MLGFAGAGSDLAHPAAANAVCAPAIPAKAIAASIPLGANSMACLPVVTRCYGTREAADTREEATTRPLSVLGTAPPMNSANSSVARHADLPPLTDHDIMRLLSHVF